jgi:hypothetical protein
MLQIEFLSFYGVIPSGAVFRAKRGISLVHGHFYEQLLCALAKTRALFEV